jgi:tetratricopeptide (TPR) repeat protein
MRDLLNGLVADLPEPAVRSIVARAEGIPLYAVETVRMLVADGRLRPRAEGGYEPVEVLGELAVPATLHALIAARLDAIDGADRVLVQDAAVLGQSFTADALAAVSGATAAEIEPRLAQLVRSDLVHVEIDPRSPERGQYAFVQALIREVAYSTLSLRDRRSRHLAAARYFEGLGDDELAGALAAHYVAAYRASSDGAEAEALRAQARLSLRAAATRAEQLGSQTQAVTYLRQAVDVAVDDADRAEMLEQAGRAAARASRADLASELLTEAVRLREAGDDPAAVALAIALQGDAIASARRRDEARQVLEEGIDRLGDLGDDPRFARLLATSAKVLVLTAEYDLAIPRANDALARAERLGLADVAAETLGVIAQAAMFQGRLWEARALLRGSMELADQIGSSDLAIRAATTLANITALDDPSEAVDVQREIITTARRLGRRALEINTIGNISEDIRRTGEWDWILGELEVARQYELDDAGEIVLDHGTAMLRVMRGEVSDEAVEKHVGRLETLEDRDVEAGKFDILGLRALTRGEFATAAETWARGTAMSDYNVPYILPRVAVAWILARRPDRAAEAIGALVARGTRGRSIDADRITVEAGIAALAGDREGALAGYRTGLAAYRDLSLPVDEALLAIQAATTLGADDPEVAGWVDGGRTILVRLRATPLLELLERAGREPASAGASVGTPTADAVESRSG